MEESFLVNINCTTVLGDSDMSHYTMFIDSSKMSIVYELVEWIRWMFSLETCFYITHNSSVIHELEDIQLLSKLKNFELKPCGRTNCVHKKTYRELLKKLNLFVSWNGLEVHKYFLHKLNQMGQKLMQESNKSNPTVHTSSSKAEPEISAPKWLQKFRDFKDKKFDDTQNINQERNDLLLSEHSLPESRNESERFVRRTTLIDKVETNWRANNEPITEMNYYSDKKIKLNENLGNSEDNFIHRNNAGSENSIVEDANMIKGSISNESPVKSKLKTVQESSKNCRKPNSKKYVKPFSLGEILSNMREELEKQKTETNIKKSSPSPSSVVFKEPDFDVKATILENSCEPEIKTTGGKKRKRTRKRKSKKENVDEFISQFLDKSMANCSSDMPQSSSSLRPNHIRFDSDEEDNLMEMEYVEENNSKIENQTNCDSMSKELNKSNGFLENKPEDSIPMVTDNEEIISVVSNAKSKVSVGGQFVAEEKLIDLESQPCDSMNQSFSANGNFESENVSPSLNMLLSLKEKFKNAVVIERFY